MSIPVPIPARCVSPPGVSQTGLARCVPDRVSQTGTTETPFGQIQHWCLRYLDHPPCTPTHGTRPAHPCHPWVHPPGTTTRQHRLRGLRVQRVHRAGQRCPPGSVSEMRNINWSGPYPHCVRSSNMARQRYQLYFLETGSFRPFEVNIELVLFLLLSKGLN